MDNCMDCVHEELPAHEKPCSACSVIDTAAFSGFVPKTATPADRIATFLDRCTNAAPGEHVEIPGDANIEVINPKELAGSKKPATWSVMPRWINLLVGRVMSVGAAKYGAFNYRDSSISASTYEDAIERHAQLWFDGEDDDPETGVSHLASIIASCALLLDAQATGKLDDNRQKTGLVRPQLDDLLELLETLPLPQPQTGA